MNKTALLVLIVLSLMMISCQEDYSNSERYVTIPESKKQTFTELVEEIQYLKVGNPSNDGVFIYPIKELFIKDDKIVVCQWSPSNLQSNVYVFDSRGSLHCKLEGGIEGPTSFSTALDFSVNGEEISILNFSDYTIKNFDFNCNLLSKIPIPSGYLRFERLSEEKFILDTDNAPCLLYTSPSPRDRTRSRMPSSA